MLRMLLRKGRLRSHFLLKTDKAVCKDFYLLKGSLIINTRISFVSVHLTPDKQFYYMIYNLVMNNGSSNVFDW